MTYVDGFVAAVPAANKDAYRDHAARSAELFADYGALRVMEAWSDDVPDGKVTDFRRAVQAQEGEVVVFSWVEWESRAARDDAWAKIMEDPRTKSDANPMPFDGKRLIYGGFEPLLDTVIGRE
jgi:uncharacterized protein YbaA (DUF1428 family)